MQSNIVTKIQEYLPEIDATELSLDADTNSHAHAQNLHDFNESIQTWSYNILENAKLPNNAHEAKALVTKYDLTTNEGCALRMIIELSSINKSLANKDAVTAALASMKLLEAVWSSSLLRDDEKDNGNAVSESKAGTAITPNQTSSKNEDDENLQLYQKTINELKEKYPHCNVNALRLLAATRLNVNKQELDDLDITPK